MSVDRYVIFVLLVIYEKLEWIQLTHLAKAQIEHGYIRRLRPQTYKQISSTNSHWR